jgi:23S rRNA pseudouridine1911/1915/1917 synthase
MAPSVTEAVIVDPFAPQVLYEDNHLIAVFKPYGMLTQGDSTGDESLFDWVKLYLKEKYAKPGNVFLGLLHRLDRPVAGIVLFGKTSKGASRLSAQIREHSLGKIYQVLVEGKWSKPEGTLVHFLRKDPVTNTVAVFTAQEPDTQRAELSVRVLGYEGQSTLLEIELKTGRSHQIRAQLAASGHPIVGDGKYGSHSRSKNIALVAAKLRFLTATDRSPQEIVLQNVGAILNRV